MTQPDLELILTQPDLELILTQPDLELILTQPYLELILIQPANRFTFDSAPLKMLAQRLRIFGVPTVEN